MTNIQISKELRNKLELISANSVIAKTLLSPEINPELLIEDYVNYISIDILEPNRLSYLDRPRFELIQKVGEDVWKSNKRYSSKPGALINRIFKSFPGKEIENFAALMKAALTVSNHTFKIVEGENIRKWYLYDSYDLVDKGTLGVSCLRHPHSQPLLDFYVANAEVIKLLILVNNTTGKLLGRTILWDIETKIMDRIYTSNSDDEFFFKQWADEHDYIYKQKQSWNTPFLFESKGVPVKMKMEIKVPKPLGYKYMPYLDTFKWMDSKTGIFYNYLPEVRDTLRTYIATNGSSYPANDLDMDDLDDHYWKQDEIVKLDYLNIKTKNTNTVWSDVCEMSILAKDSSYDEELGDYIFNKEYEFLNKMDKINSIKERRKLVIEQKRLKLSQKNLETVNQLSSILMEYYRNGDVNINDADLESIQQLNGLMDTLEFRETSSFTSMYNTRDLFDRYRATTTQAIMEDEIADDEEHVPQNEAGEVRAQPDQPANPEVVEPNRAQPGDLGRFFTIRTSRRR